MSVRLVRSSFVPADHIPSRQPGLPAPHVDRFAAQLASTMLRLPAGEREGVLDRTLRQVIDRAMTLTRTETARESGALPSENTHLQEGIRDLHGFHEIIGDARPLRDALSRVEVVAGTDSTVLLLGETGTGKELFARAIHDRSPRRRRSLVRVNCAALPATLIESELFGHERGAFTGAVATRQGRFELADKATLFLDEIGDLPLDLQAKLLRVLQEGEFERVGSSHTRRCDVRVVAATHRNLELAVEEGRFREDLYYRVSVFPIELPPLRVRREDIPQLVWCFIHRRQRALQRRIEKVPNTVMQSLQGYSWPGNVRELENVIERAMIRSTGESLELDGGPGARQRQAATASEQTLVANQRPRQCGRDARDASEHAALPSAEARNQQARGGQIDIGC